MKHSVLTIKATDRPGLLHLITGVIEKRLVRIMSLSSARTDVHDIVLVTVELEAEEAVITYLSLKLQNIIEVFGVEVADYQEQSCLRAAYFKLDRASDALAQHQVTVVGWEADSLIVAKYGTDAAIRSLYNALDGPHLLGFSQTGLITASALMGDESSVISWAA